MGMFRSLRPNGSVISLGLMGLSEIVDVDIKGTLGRESVVEQLGLEIMGGTLGMLSDKDLLGVLGCSISTWDELVVWTGGGSSLSVSMYSGDFG